MLEYAQGVWLNTEKNMEYRLVRSSRRTVSVSVGISGEVTVRAPLNMPRKDIDAFVEKEKTKIEKYRDRALRQIGDADLTPFTGDEIKDMADEALRVIPGRVKYYADIMGVTYGRITIRNQKTKWGSCSSRGNLNFNCLLMKVPPRVLDSVVVHELCHRTELNHSGRFYDLLLRVFPDYYECDKWLKENGRVLMMRMTGQ